MGETSNWLPELVEKARKLKVGPGHLQGTDVGPLISVDAKKRVEELIQAGVDDGANLLLDGRGVQITIEDGKYSKGFNNYHQ